MATPLHVASEHHYILLISTVKCYYTEKKELSRDTKFKKMTELQDAQKMHTSILLRSVVFHLIYSKLPTEVHQSN